MKCYRIEKSIIITMLSIVISTAQRLLSFSDNDGWHYVSVDKAAKVAGYEERTLFKMPTGEYEGYCYYIPNTLLRENEEKGTIRVSLSDDFVVALLNRNAEKGRRTQGGNESREVH